MKSLSRFIFSAIIPEILAQSVFKDVTITTSIEASNLSPSAGLQSGATTNQGEISGVIYYNNCNFTSKLLGTISYPEETSNTIPLTSNLPANYSQWVKFDSLQVFNDTVVALSATSISGPSESIPISFTTNNSSDCNARVICTGSLLDYSLTFGGFQCFDSDVGTVSAYGLCAGLYLGSEGTQLPCQPGSICTYNNQFDSQCLPISEEDA